MLGAPSEEIYADVHVCGGLQGVYGMVLVSGLVKEMIGFIETVVVKGSPADRFACEVSL